MKDYEKKYEIWLEVEQYDIESDKSSHEEYCNAVISFPDQQKSDTTEGTVEKNLSLFQAPRFMVWVLSGLITDN